MFTPVVLLILAAGTAALCVFSVVTDVVARDRSRMNRRVNDEFRRRQRESVKESPLLRGFQAGAAAGEAGPSGRWLRFAAWVESANAGVTPRQVLVAAAGFGGVLGAVGLVLRHNWLVGLAGLATGAALPLLYVHVRRMAYTGKLLKQLPDAFDLIARVLRAGQPIPQAMQAVADEFEAPIAAEFSYCYEQQKLGLPAEVALRDLARRTGLLELKILVLAVLIQQQTGGNLAALVDNLAEVVRDRLRIRDKVKALTGEGRMQAAVLLALPPFMFVVMLFMRPAYAHELLARPNLIVGMTVSMALGAAWIRKIISLDV
jgi:tight adherence protein B